MTFLTEAEAREFLSQPLFCYDCDNWQFNPTTQRHSCSMGLVDGQGVRTGLVVDLSYSFFNRTRKTYFVFSVFKLFPKGKLRVYQLDIRKFSRPVKDSHVKPHEHIGNLRVNGEDCWGSWSFRETLNRFINQTNITFSPDVQDPTEFKLK